MDIELARRNMIASQIRPWNVLNPEILDLIDRVPREEFVPPAYRALAFADCAIPIGHGETMMTPRVEARMLQALAPKPGERALEIGTGSGYVTALLASMADSVISIDIRDDFVSAATAKLTDHRITNCDVRTADGSRGYYQDTPFDVVACTGALTTFDTQLLDMLGIGGRMFVVIGTAPAMDALLITKLNDTDCSREVLFETELRTLQNAPDRGAFHF